MTIVSQQTIDEELYKTHKPTVYTDHPLPLNDLSDRQFEILLYHVFKERLLSRQDDVVAVCDNVSLMQGVGEQGRDVLLSKKGINAGIIQCKRQKNNLSDHEVGSEILKFVMYYLNDDSLIGDVADFRYYFAVSTGFTGKAIGHFNDFGHFLCNEPKLEEWFYEIVRSYPVRFKNWKFDKKEHAIKAILGKIRIEKIVPQDIEVWLSQFDYLYELFFKILTVTDNALLENIVEDYLKPILRKLNIKPLDNPDYTIRFKEYLKDNFNHYSTAKTLVFGNQQKKLEDFYYPLKVIKESPDSITEKELLVLNEFKDDFIPKYKKVIVIDDGGMGKSTIFKWLFLSCIKLNKGIPIFIELRNLNKNNDLLDEITNKLNPLNFIIEKKATAEILSQRGFVFFFDGYDEIKFENREFVTKDLQNFISKCKGCFFAISSRPEKALLAFSDFQEFSINKMEKNEAFELIRKMDDYQERSKRLIEQIDVVGLREMNEFLSNPLLVSLLYKKFEYRESISFNKQEFFYEVFEALFQAHDLSKGGSYIREKESKLSLSEFFQILRGIGFRCIKEGIQFNEAQLFEIIDLVKKEFAKEFDSYSFLNDLTKAVPLFHRDGLSIRWAHKSIQQYFAAEYICRDSKQNQEKILMTLYKSHKADSYAPILKLCYEIDYKSFRSSIIFLFCKEFIDFFEKDCFPNLSRAGIVDHRDLVIRKSLLYKTDYALFRPATKTRLLIREKAIGEMEKEWGGGRWVPLDGAPRGFELFSDEYIFDFDFRYILLEFNHELVDPLTYLDYEKNSIPRNFPIEPGTLFFFDNDDPAHALNKPENFKILNKVLLRETVLIDYEKVKEVYNVIKEEKETNYDSDIIAGL